MSQAFEKFYEEQQNLTTQLLNKVNIIQDALSSATVESFYNIMVNEVKNEQKKEMDELKAKLNKAEKEKKEYTENTNKVIEKLTMLSVLKDDHIQNMTSDMSMLNQSFSLPSDSLLESNSKKKTKDTKKEQKLTKQVNEMEDKIIGFQKQIRDLKSDINYYRRKEAKYLEQEQEYIKRIFILEEFMIRSHSVIQRRAARHMKTLKKAKNLDGEINSFELTYFRHINEKQRVNNEIEESK